MPEQVRITLIQNAIDVQKQHPTKEQNGENAFFEPVHLAKAL